jgi:hypothetical protein
MTEALERKPAERPAPATSSRRRHPEIMIGETLADPENPRRCR